MKTFKITSLVGLLLILTAWTVPPQQTEKSIEGVWVYQSYQDGKLEYHQKKKFDTNKSGIEFKEDGTLIKRQNSGWCGTPPISYSNEKGSWEKTSDSTITITYKYWGGTTEEKLLIVKLTNNVFVYKNLERKSIKQ